MGNSHTKEERVGSHHQGSATEPSGSGFVRSSRHGEPSATRHSSRPELSPLGIAITGASGSRHQDVPFERRETRQEREARKLEKERAARIKERERSMKEEHVDGGYLVTMGIYTASEDFTPFWRGLDDFKDTWAEHQIIAAARGLEIPPADQVPEHLVPQPRSGSDSPETSSSNLNNLTVPMGSPPSMPSATSPAASKATSPLKQPKKALAAALNLSRNSSQAEIAPREINLPHDPFVNGQALEVFLYKEGEECPLCLMYYPPYLNRTRCCCQLICSECFVQIKRPEPHFPEHHGDGPNVEDSQANPEERNERLIMEPAKCPYCTQSDFGIIYEPPPFRRGLTYAFPPSSLGAMSTAMSSMSSVNSTLSPTSASPSRPTRNRAQSLSANAPGVVTADRIRPDWTGKLATALAHQRRRAAAADALHHAAFVMGNQEPRTFFSRSSRFSRRATGSYRGSESPGSSTNVHDGADDTSPGHGPGAPPPAPRGNTNRDRIDAAHLESMMMAEAIRLSLADEEERRKKAEKEARKDAKKREKEERKTAKNKGEVYSGGSDSASPLSIGIGRRRGNSGTGNLRVDASVAAATMSATTQGSTSGSPPHDKGKYVERGIPDEASIPIASSSSTLPIPTPQVLRGSSHLRQMSNASSLSSSGVDSAPGSYTGRSRSAEDPYDSPLSLGGQSNQGDNAGSEPLFNFRSLAEVVGVSIDGQGCPIDECTQTHQSEVYDKAHGEHVERVETPAGAAVAGSNNEPNIEKHDTTIDIPAARGESPPGVVVTPGTPVPVDDDEGSKQLGHFHTRERSRELT
ncbi:hypothetical protein NUW58_g3818 [Xylaria curta]|uniref:Uncharacterized protein n=1 Tax=Xylaria curta TaxID=42375 RepID=A0ACC1PC86_9PEZI|nr:hypothetical protein NUW58_g3818 [Xylaria curta]